MDIDTLAYQIHKNAVEKGWWELSDLDVINPTNFIASKLLLIVTEVAEATEELRHNNIDVYLKGDEKNNPKPEGLIVELADTIIRCLDLAESLHRQGFVSQSIGEIILQKMEYNKTRTYKHGGKAL